MFRQAFILCFVVAMFAGCVTSADQQTEPSSPEQAGDDDSTRPPQARLAADGKGTTSNLIGTGPIAYGTVLADGTKVSGTSNWTSTYNPDFQRLEIAITGESYFYLDYATVVTPLGDVRFCRTGSINGKLTVYCHDHTGAAATSRIAFVTSKP